MSLRIVLSAQFADTAAVFATTVLLLLVLEQTKPTSYCSNAESPDFAVIGAALLYVPRGRGDERLRQYDLTEIETTEKR